MYYYNRAQLESYGLRWLSHDLVLGVGWREAICAQWEGKRAIPELDHLVVVVSIADLREQFDEDATETVDPEPRPCAHIFDALSHGWPSLGRWEDVVNELPFWARQQH